jgi:hypothetical protein
MEEPHFNLWNYFFCTWLQQGSDVEAAVWGSVDIFVRSGSGVDPYFCFSIFDPLVGWQKVWFFLRNNADAPFPMFMVAVPFLNPNGGTGWLNNTSAGCNSCATSFDGCYEVG